LVSLKEAHKHAFLFITQVHANQAYLGWVALLQLDGLHANVAGRLQRGLARLLCLNHHL
jgi:hypothetical protein